jgi:hypothetical protein
MQLRTIPLPWTTLVVASENDAFFPATPFMEAPSITTIRRALEIAAEFGDMEVAVAYQTADVENAPDTPVAFGGFQSTIDVFYPDALTNIASVTAGKQLIRFGFVARNKSGQGTTPSMMRVGGRVESAS